MKMRLYISSGGSFKQLCVTYRHNLVFLKQALRRVSVSWKNWEYKEKFLSWSQFFFFISLSTLDFRDFEKWIFLFLFLLSILESGKTNFSFYSRFPRHLKTEILVHFRYPGSCNDGVFGWQKVICRNTSISFWKFSFLFSKNMGSQFLFLLLKHENFFKFLFLLSFLLFGLSLSSMPGWRVGWIHVYVHTSVLRIDFYICYC